MPRQVPTVRQRQLGRELRELREARRLSADYVATQLGWSRPKVTRFETAATRPTTSDVERMIDVYGVSPDRRARLLELAHEAQKRGWWVQYGDITGPYVPLEDAADSIRDFAVQLIPGLLQTQGYARAVIEAGRSADPAGIERLVRFRRARQVLLDRENPPDLDVIIAEPAFRWKIGSPDVMHGQRRALLEAAERPNVTIRVLPTSAGANAGLDGPCVIFGFDDDDFPDVAYAAGQAGGNYVESRDEVERITLNWNDIADKALSVEQSATWIADFVEE
jgi:transcriptional regulator with XRE-family HTH domain